MAPFILLIASIVTAAVLGYTSSAQPTEQLRKRITYPFNADLQSVSTSGDHAFAFAPNVHTQRGPCPGLNALANHGYINRKGQTNVLEVANGMQTAYGVSPDFGALIAILGAAFAGDGFQFSISGPPPPQLLGGILLGQPRGLSNSHNHFEGDGSISRDDLYQTGNDVLVNINHFKELMDMGVDNYDLTALGTNAAKRFDYSIANNPYFLRTQIGFGVPPGTNGLVAHLMSNKTEEGTYVLPPSMIMSFFGVSKDANGDYKYTEGSERIPDNWYKWNPAFEYTTANFAADVAQVYAENPRTIAIGGNTGTVNSFAGLNVGDLSGGVFSLADLAKGNNAACLMYQQLESLMPDLLRKGGIIGQVDALMANVTDIFSTALLPLSCPQLRNITNTDLSAYPGSTQLRDDGTYNGKLQSA